MKNDLLKKKEIQQRIFMNFSSNCFGNNFLRKQLYQLDNKQLDKACEIK